jgi:hypothetical protein
MILLILRCSRMRQRALAKFSAQCAALFSRFLVDSGSMTFWRESGSEDSYTAWIQDSAPDPDLFFSGFQMPAINKFFVFITYWRKNLLYVVPKDKFIKKLQKRFY